MTASMTTGNTSFSGITAPGVTLGNVFPVVVMMVVVVVRVVVGGEYGVSIYLVLYCNISICVLYWSPHIYYFNH